MIVTYQKMQRKQFCCLQMAALTARPSAICLNRVHSVCFSPTEQKLRRYTRDASIEIKWCLQNLCKQINFFFSLTGYPKRNWCTTCNCKLISEHKFYKVIKLNNIIKWLIKLLLRKIKTYNLKTFLGSTTLSKTKSWAVKSVWTNELWTQDLEH